MKEYRIYFATNRNHVGPDRWHPDSYGTKFSDDGMENLRFGEASIAADDGRIDAFIGKRMGRCGTGDGEGLSGYLAGCAKSARIDAYPETLSNAISDAEQKDAKLGSVTLFSNVMADMKKSSDVLIYIHGYNVSWSDALGSALSLQIMLNNSERKDPDQDVLVVLFTWPSDGMALPWVSYKSDRSEATGSGAAVGRAFLKARDFLAALRDRARGEALCGQDIHLLCHSMGNFLLQSALSRLYDFTPGSSLPRLFEHVFLCAADVDDDALESGQPLARLPQISRNVTIYHNREDRAMWISDFTKGNPERLGSSGAAHPALLHSKIHQVDCTPIVSGLVEHSYYLDGFVNEDIRASMDGWTQEDPRRRRARSLYNAWEMK